MKKRNMLDLRRLAVFFTLIALAGLSAGRANAAAVFLWVADGADLLGYASTGGTPIVTQAAPSGGDYFSVTAYGPSSSNEYVAVSDATNHTLTEYLWNGTSLTTPISTSTFNFPSDPAGGAISPQEIAIDGSGNLWSTSAGGNVTEFCGNSGGCTVNSHGYAAGAVIQTVTVPTADGAPRGIMVDGSTIYVTTSSYGASGSGVYDFTLNGSGVAGSLATYHALSANTTGGGDETGQLRGITYTSDPTAQILWADSTWGASGADQGYIDENTGTATALTTLNGPNALMTGDGTAASGALESACDVLYIANYYAGTVEEANTGRLASGGSFNSTCTSTGDYGTTSTFVTISGKNISGIALSVGEGGLGDDALPTGLFVAPVPEPGTLPLMAGGLLLAFGIAIRVQRRRRLQ